MSLLRWLGLGRQAPAPAQSRAGDVEAVRRIAGMLEQMDPDRARYVAAFAYLLGRVAHADLDISEVETRAMERIVTEWGGLPEAQAILVVEIAKTQNRLFGATESYLAARELRDVATHEEKHALLQALFAISAADDSISTTEEEEIRKIARELALSGDEYLAIRATYREKREILKDGAGRK